MTTATADLSKIAEILEEQDKKDAARKASELARTVGNDGKQYPIVMDDLRDLLDNLDERSFKELEDSILKDGVRDPLVVWKEKNAILDGHNRLRVIKKHNLPYKTTELSFPDANEAEEWMIRNQLGRRNLTADRFDYYIGKLYNQAKEPSEKPQNLHDAAAKLAEEFGVSERTVRRAGDTSLGVDKLEQIKGRIAKQQQLSGKGNLNKPELTELGKMPNAATATKFLSKLGDLKTKEKAKKQADRVEAKGVAALPESYPVVFMQPPVDDVGFNINTTPRPPVAKDAMVYLLVPDHALEFGMDMVKKWGLTYEGSVIYYTSITEEGTYTKVVHHQVLLATKGTVVIKKGVEVASVQKYTGQIGDAVVKLIEAYHPSAKKLDMRKGRTAKGFDGVKTNT